MAKPGVTTHPPWPSPSARLTTVTCRRRRRIRRSRRTSTSRPSRRPVSEASLTAANQPAFYPSLLRAQVRLPAAETLSRSSFDDGSEPGRCRHLPLRPLRDRRVHHPGVVPCGGGRDPRPWPGPIDPTGSTNPGSVYAGLLNSSPLNFPADMVGGLSNPNLGVNGLSGAAGRHRRHPRPVRPERPGAHLRVLRRPHQQQLPGRALPLGHPRGVPRRPEAPVDHQQVATDGTVDSDLHPPDHPAGRPRLRLRPRSGQRQCSP